MKFIYETDVGNISVSDVFSGLHSGRRQNKHAILCVMFIISVKIGGFWVISVTS
jgi:hypothetical protein